ncbi:MAG: ribosomal protein S18-alanine N-acetyltransferase [Candidatus Zixiibacteriota bacterium]|nr:MAG: ribosomal protein S18-alanine N-acetyltransferase [candidate division Zixibacteria bacterium]
MNVEKGNELPIVIRQMTESDLRAVVKLERLIFPDPWSAAAFKEQLATDGWGAIVAEYEGRVIGYACYYVVLGESHLTNIAVRGDYRRKSVAKQLLENILQVVLGYNCEYIFLEVRPSNRGAVAFYERHGFDILYRRPNYYRKPVEDALVMGRYLGVHERSG